MSRRLPLAPAFLAVLALAALSCTRDGLHVSALFDSASGLKRGVAVEVAGVPVGEVEDIRLDHNEARVLVRIDRGVEVKTGSELHMTSRGLLGDKFLRLSPGSGTPVGERAELPGEDATDALTAGTARMLVQAEAALDDVHAVTAILRKAAEKDGPAGLRPLLGDTGVKPPP